MARDEHKVTMNTMADSSAEPSTADRREFLAATSSSLVMAGGLAVSYGTFFVMAGRFLYPSDKGKAWMFVSDAAGIGPGEAVEFQSPTGMRVTVTRERDGPHRPQPTLDSFMALSSVCPHLGCRVHWEPHNDRYFCPCHNGVFDPAGNPVSGPPAADGQQLSRYPLQIIDGALYIELPYSPVGERT